MPFSEIKQNAELIGIGALKWNDLKRSPEQDIAFEWEDILNMQGNSGPYLQYSYARTQSVILKAQERGVEMGNQLLPKTLHPEERSLLLLLSRFDEVVEEAATRFAPNVLCTYLFTLAQSFNGFYQKCQILKEKEPIKQFRLSLTSSTGEVIKDGLTLLGIQAPERM